MAESRTVENPKPDKKPKKVRYLKMTVIGDLKAKTITKKVKEQIKNTADLTTDNSISYKEIENTCIHIKLALSQKKNLKNTSLDIYSYKQCQKAVIGCILQSKT